MKHVQIALMFIALGTGIAAIWFPDSIWQLILTTVILLIAAAGIEASKMPSNNSPEGGRK